MDDVKNSKHYREAIAEKNVINIKFTTNKL